MTTTIDPDSVAPQAGRFSEAVLRLTCEELPAEFLTDYERRYDPFVPLGYFTFKRTYARRIPEFGGRTEEWWETVARCVRGACRIGAGYTPAEAQELYDAVFNLKVMFSGRALWRLGVESPGETVYGNSLVNCWHVNITSVDDILFTFEQSMLGGGVGFSVRDEHVRQLPAVRPGVKVRSVDLDDCFAPAGLPRWVYGTKLDGDGTNHTTHVSVPGIDEPVLVCGDSREGWADLLGAVLHAYLRDGTSVVYSTSFVRPEGIPIDGFGGVAAGPEPLIAGIEKLCKLLDGRAGQKLTSVDVVDIVNICGEIVVSGNVRRSAQIAQGDPGDVAFLAAKNWTTGNIPSWRAMSNNSVICSDTTTLPDAFWNGYQGNGEPYGLLNLDNARRYARMGDPRPDPSAEGYNPCGEIPLADSEPCNLAELVLPHIESQAEMIRLATLIYRTQKAITALPYLHARTTHVVHQNMRVGLGVTGVLQARHTWRWLHPTYEALRTFDQEWSAQHGWPESVRLTTVKPSGTISTMVGVTPGCHPAYATRYLRRIRVASSSPLMAYVRQAGLPHEPARDFQGVEDPRTMVVSFPIEIPAGTTVAEDMSAIDQLEVVRMLQRDWADNAVSCTVYYRLEELGTIRAWLADNYHELKGVSFLLHSDHGFEQAPYEPINAQEYAEIAASVSDTRVTLGDTTTDDIEAECAGGACPTR